MKKGTVIYHSNIEYYDGEHGKKLLVVLTDFSPTQPFICLKTTSKIKFGKDTTGCYSDLNVYVTIKQPFKEKTWIQFDWPNAFFPIEYNKILQLKFNKTIKQIGEMEKNDFNGLINCIRKSDDVPSEYINILQKI